MDQFDRASDVERRFIESAIAKARRAPALGVSRTHCAECGDEIPEARRRAIAGCKLCIVCQQEEEAMHEQSTTWNS